ncbi:MAG: hypothetical protein TREMPRED_001551 [Tremellales sp. Tagirdzhanova-0007]|nr:MAG: hypothetical protein TREMPRED_001551 [Tremellales sp. Tagirdzhanova-0007]
MGQSHRVPTENAFRGDEALCRSGRPRRILAKLSSTPPLSSSSKSSGPGAVTPYTPAQSTPQQGSSNGGYSDHGGAFGAKGDVWLTDPSLGSPPSPPRNGLTNEPRSAGDFYLPFDNALVANDGVNFTTHPSSFRRHNLSLNINSLPAPFQNVHLSSPTSAASSGAPHTDSFSLHNFNVGQDYFQFDEASLPSATESNLESHPLQTNQITNRLPASQPTSPVRGMFAHGQVPYVRQSGRQRGATFSGSFAPYGGGSLYTLSQAPMTASAVPSHIALDRFESPLLSPLIPSPIINASPTQLTADQGYFGDISLAPQSSSISFGEVLRMQNISTPTPTTSRSLSRRTSYFDGQTKSTAQEAAEIAEKMTVLDAIVTSARSAQDALLRGREVDVSANLGHLSNHLDAATVLGVGPSQTPQDGTTSPVTAINYQPNHTTMNAVTMKSVSMPPPALSTPHPNVGTYRAPPLSMSGLNSPLAVDRDPKTLRVSPIAPTNTAMTAGLQYLRAESSRIDLTNRPLQIPVLSHSHSFPNVHQLPSQLHTLPPSTPVLESPSLSGPLSMAQHVPLISSPLASMSSRPSSEPWPFLNFEQPWTGELMAPPPTEPKPALSRQPSQKEKDGRVDGRPVVTRSRSTSVNKNHWSNFPSITPTEPPPVEPSRPATPEDDDDEDSEDEGPKRIKRRRSSVGKEDGPDLGFNNATFISDDIRRQLDQIFEDFLNSICSDLDVCDSKGEKLHQVLMPKKMARLGESADYRPFKFRIQAFTNAFHEELQIRGITEDIMSVKKVKTYLWHQDLISRFNADGKKAKSKGNHIWNVDAKKLPGGGWVFRPFKRRIMGQPNPFALVNQKYEWEPKIWDPQAASDAIRPNFKSPPGTLPLWLKWEDDLKLVGVPVTPTAPIKITAIAEFTNGSGGKSTLETTFTVQAVLPQLDSYDDSAALYAQAQADFMNAWGGDYVDETINPLGLPCRALKDSQIKKTTMALDGL